jgi:transaldolase
MNHLKVNPGCDLHSMQRELIEEVVGAFIAEIVIKIPVTNFGIDVTRKLAA